MVNGESAFWSLLGQIELAESAREASAGTRPPPGAEREAEPRAGDLRLGPGVVEHVEDPHGPPHVPGETLTDSVSAPLA
jgi:hypothetical protein